MIEKIFETTTSEEVYGPLSLQQQTLDFSLLFDENESNSKELLPETEEAPTDKQQCG